MPYELTAIRLFVLVVRGIMKELKCSWNMELIQTFLVLTGQRFLMLCIATTKA
jgi:hypothetical protein